MRGLPSKPPRKRLQRFKIDLTWHTLEGYFERLNKAGSSVNLASYVSAGQVRESVLGYANRAPSAEELDRMRQLVASTMEQGAFGLVSIRASHWRIREERGAD